MKNFPKVFIIVLNYNGRDVIKRCLSSVFKADYPNFEVIFVDNNSKDGSFEIAKANFSRAVFIRNEENLGFATGCNVGIKFALERMADYVLLLNMDTEVEKDFLSRLVEVAQSQDHIGLLSPVIFNGQNKQIWFSGGKINWLNMKSVHNQKIRTEDFYDSEFLTGCAMLIKSDVFRKIGLLDEDYFLYWEDADFALKSKRAGFRNVVVTASWVYHFEKSEKNKSEKIYWLVISGLVFFRKNTPFILRPWIKFYLLMRKTKNLLDVIFKRNPLAPSVRRAYRDFKHAKF
jgi:GT2 family glycosyltransferase